MTNAISTSHAACLVLLAAVAGLAGCTGEERVVRTYPGTLALDGIDQLDVKVEDGDLTLTGEAGLADVDVGLDLVTEKTGEDKDDKAIDAVHMELLDLGDGSARLFVWMDPNVAGYSLHLRATIPDDLHATVEMDDGDTTLRTTGDVDVVDGGGAIDAADIVGTLSIADAGGDMTVDGVTGTVVIDDGAGDIEVLNVDGDVEIDDGADDIHVAHITGTCTIRDGAGDIHAEDIGTFNLESDTGGGLTLE